MPKIELTIDKNYLPSWDIWHGLRELVQNGKDAEVEFNAPLTVDFYNDTLRIENEGCTLPRSALLLGRSSKGERADMIGQFGEGMKLGILALVRKGVPVTIRTGGEVWKPEIRPSDTFEGTEVLTFNIQTGREDKNRVRVEIGCSREGWDSVKDRFLFLCRETKDDRIKTDYGTLLTAPRFKGRVYVKGIYVQTDTTLSHGYDFSNATLDRDRRMLDSYDAGQYRRRIWESAVAQRPDLFETFHEMLELSTPDLSGINDYNGQYVDSDLRKQVVAKFLSRHGDEAVPVATLGESREIEHLGKRGVVVPSGLRAILATAFGTLDTVKQALRNEVKATYGWHDLTDVEKANLTRSVDLVAGAVSDAQLLDKVDVVDFRSADLLGQHKAGRYLLSRSILGDFRNAIETLVHEVAHDQGGDGEKGHVAAMERIWSGIVVALVK